MLRSLKVVGVVAFTIAVPSLALANSGVVTPGASGGGGPSFETSVTVDTGPLTQKCPATVTIHATTTLLNPDGNPAHAHATARVQLGNTQTNPPQKLDFTSKTTQTWTATYPDPDIGAIGESAVYVQITDWSGTTTQEISAPWGSFQYGCGRPTAGIPTSIPGVTPAQGNCQGYKESQLSVVPANNNNEVKFTGITTANGTTQSSSLFYFNTKADADQAYDVIKHFTNMCSIQDSSLIYFEGAGARNEPNWGKCVAYDGKNVTISNDATGWLVKSGSFLIARLPLEADARTIAEAAKRRSNDCHIGEGTEPGSRVVHYLH
jgi:hypothetical protein